MIKHALIKVVHFYQRYISPVIVRHFGHTCRFQPTCSQYMIDAIEKYGIFRGVLRGVWRILRCNPFSKGGYDPVR